MGTLPPPWTACPNIDHPVCEEVLPDIQLKPLLVQLEVFSHPLRKETPPCYSLLFSRLNSANKQLLFSYMLSPSIHQDRAGYWWVLLQPRAARLLSKPPISLKPDGLCPTWDRSLSYSRTTACVQPSLSPPGRAARPRPRPSFI